MQGQNVIGQPSANGLIDIKRDLLNSLSPDYLSGIKNSSIQKIIMRRRSKEQDKQTMHAHKNSATVVPPLASGLTPLNRPSFNFYEDINNIENKQFIETERGLDIRRAITPADMPNQVHTSVGKMGNFTQQDQTQKYDIHINVSGSGMDDEASGDNDHEKGMPMFYESRDYGIKTVTIDKLSQKDHDDLDHSNVGVKQRFNLEDDSLDKDKFGDYVRQNAGLKPKTSISTYDAEFQKKLDEELLD